METELSLLEGQQQLHEMIAHQHPLGETLAAITDWASTLLPEGLVSLMRYEPERSTLSLVPNQAFSAEYTERLQALVIGPEVGTCGRAAHQCDLVVTEDIRRDPNWAEFRDAAEREGLRACWSMPILTRDQELLGTFAVYHRTPARPGRDALRHLQQVASLAALAILRDREAQEKRTTEARYRSLFTEHPDGVYELDRDGRFRHGNRALERLTGYSLETMRGRHFRDFIMDDEQATPFTAFARALAGEPQHCEVQGHHAAGYLCHLEVTTLPIVVGERIVGVYGICRDITRRRQRDATLRLLQRGIEATPSGVAMADATRPDMPLVYVNPAFCQLTGYAASEILGRNCRFLQGPETDPAAVTQLRQALAEREEVQVTLRNYRRDGTPFWNQVSLAPVLDDQGRCTHIVGTQQDVTQQREQAAQLAFQARHDPLTRLPNRAVLEAHLLQANRLSRERDELCIVMILDLDGFNLINDGLGHEMGNRLLVAVARRLQQTLRGTDTLARLTADEFCVLAPGLIRQQDAVALAERLLHQLARPFEVGGHVLHLSASLGMSGSEPAILAPPMLLQHAHLAMREAKRQGGNTWQWYRQAPRTDTREYVALRREIQEAIEQEQFVLHYQPVVDTVSGRIRSVEALVRWHHPVRGEVSPGVFIPLAEQTGQIIALGRWVLRRACQDIAALNAEADHVLPVAVNISPLQFRRTGFLDEVKCALADSGLPPHHLELEVTEGVLLSGVDPAIALLHELRALGIQMAIDDFGTGFSSLRYLRDLPITKVKIDRAFVHDIARHGDSAAIVQGVITLAHHLDLVVVAEGIETREQQQELMRRGCDLLQGFLFARPMPLQTLKTLPSRLPEAP